MKRWITVICVLAAVGCGKDPVDEKNTNNGPNNTSNNGPNNTSNNLSNNANNETPTNNGTNSQNLMNGCVFDADCRGGEACEGQVCVQVCFDEMDCAAGEVCAPGVNTQQNVCQPSSNNTNGMPNNLTNNTTNTNNNTNNVGTELDIVMIQSTTTSAAACEDVFDPGPDLFGVALEDEVGSILGWGSLVYENIQVQDNDYIDAGLIDGTAPDISGGDVCPDMFDGNVVSLGCEAASYLLVEFLDENGLPVRLNAVDRQAVRVYEWGGQCTTGSVDDTYNVSICTSTADARIGDTSSCTIQLIVDGSGETVGDVGQF